MADARLHPDDLIMQLRKLEERVRTLETANRLTFSTVGETGLLTVVDSSGTLIAELGATNASNTSGGPPAGTVGVAVYDPVSGNLVFRAGTNVDLAGNAGIEARDTTTGFTALMATTLGLVTPYIAYHPGPMTGFAATYDTTSTTFVTVYESFCYRIPADAMRHRAWASVDASTTGELRMIQTSANPQQTNPKSVTSTSQTGFDFIWQHGAPMHASAPFQLQARVASGAGAIHVWPARSSFGFGGHTVDSATTGG